MFGQLIHRLAASSISPMVEKESPVGPEDSVEQENAVRQWRVVSRDGVSSLFDLDLPQCDPGGPDPRVPVESIVPVESTVAENETGSSGMRGSAWNDTTKKNVAAPFSINAPVIGSRGRSPTNPNIGMPAALPRTTEILQAAAASRSIETQEPIGHGTQLLGRHETQPDRGDTSEKEAVHANPSSPAAGDSDAISRSLVADAAAAAPVRFNPASPMALLKTPAAGREIDANLAKIITQWSSLTWPIQAAVLAMVNAAAHES